MERVKPLIIAHRGASKDAPENTLAAFRLAVEQGADAVELDVHLSKDDKLVVIHNDSVNKTTNGKGIVGDMTVKELKKLDAGSWFDKRFKGEKIPLLEEVFQVLPPNFLINIEIKNIPSFYEGIEAKVISLIKSYHRLEDVIISSFDHKCLKKVNLLEPTVKIGLLYSENLFDPTRYAFESNIPIYSLHPKYQTVNQSDVREAHNRDMKVFPWTVNKKNEMEKLISYGVDGMITDDPAKLKKLLDEKSF